MKEKKKDFIKLLEDLCIIYKDYISKNSDSILEVYINNNMIKMCLNNGSCLVDQFGLVFNQKEKDSYIFISMILMKILFSKKIIYSKNNVFFDNIDKATIKIVVNDENVFDRMFSVISIHNDIDFYNRIDINRRIRNKVNRNRNASHLDERVSMTKKLLRVRGAK